MASDLRAILGDVKIRALLHQSHDQTGLEVITLQACDGEWCEFLARRLEHLLEQQPQVASTSQLLFSLASATFDCFLQANVTGPPLPFDPADAILPSSLFEGTNYTVELVQRRLIASLSVDGEAVYRLIPHVELFCLANCILNHPLMTQDLQLKLARLRVNFWHQRLLTDISSSLQEKIYDDLRLIGDILFLDKAVKSVIAPAQFLLERATIHIHHGFDKKAREDIEQAARERSFHFALTGRLGKRTKYQEKSLSQLVVLARSADADEVIRDEGPQVDVGKAGSTPSQLTHNVPRNLDLDDDTLLESIAFTKIAASDSNPQQDDQLHRSLEYLDPGNQPLLQPLDAIILLATASSITNTSPADGLTREETLPYAERVISGGSSNWQVYTQALLVRSRIEGYRSRTIERGVLQLQAVVDQVIAETSSINASSKDDAAAAKSTTFLPRPKTSESASASERLQFIHQLATPPRWMLESELADCWVSLGGLRTALEIYERLQMWAEVALCWAANDREDRARKIIRRQLYNSVITTSTKKLLEDDEDNDMGDYRIERNPLPADAPRLFCILGDLERSPAAYERAWEISNQRYARAQRSLGQYYSRNGETERAGTAYARSLKVSPQNHATWFALGCIRLQQEDWAGAVDAFGRAVQIEDSDAESWSNLAVALLKLPPEISVENSNSPDAKPDKPHPNDEEVQDDDSNGSNKIKPALDPQKHVREAFLALKRAAVLKRESFRIWQNLLSVAVQLSPPPYTEIIIAQTRLIELLGNVEGEKCVDAEVVEALVTHLVTTYPRAPTEAGVMEINAQLPENDNAVQSSERHKVGFERMVIDLVQKKIMPLITSSRRLWLLTAKLFLYLQRPSSALSAYEKAWRVTLNQPGWESGTQEAKNAWKEVAESTIDLIDGYESLGERNRESGMGAGELVAKDWRFKARSAARSVIARAKEGWEGDEGYETLVERLKDLRNA